MLTDLRCVTQACTRVPTNISATFFVISASLLEKIFLLELSVERAHLPMAIVSGTVTKREIVERSRIDADSASIALYLAANKTTVVAMGKLQQTRASRAKGPFTWSMWKRANKTSVCSVTRPRAPSSTAFDKWKECAARVRPTANTATPEVAEPLIEKELATSFGM